jgi:hypothetical protein
MGCLKRLISSLVDFISEEQTKENDKKVDSLFFVIAKLLSETQGLSQKP